MPTKFEIYTDTFFFSLNSKSKEKIPAFTSEEILDTYQSCDTRITSNALDPVKVASFDTLEEAQKEFSAHYAHYGNTYPEKTQIGWSLTGQIAWLEQNEYDEDGEFDQGGAVLAFSAEAWTSPVHILTSFFEDNGGGIHVIVERDGEVVNIISGFEREAGVWQPQDLLSDARYGFPDADPYDPDDYEDLSLEELAKEIGEMDELIAETGTDGEWIYPEKMGIAGKMLFGIKD